MDPLTQQLIQRQMAGQGSQPPLQPQPMPSVPPNIPQHMPTQAQRWMNAQQIQNAYANGWTPNPILLRAVLGNR